MKIDRTALFVGIVMVVAAGFPGYSSGEGAADVDDQTQTEKPKAVTIDLGNKKAELGYAYGARVAQHMVSMGLDKHVELEAIFQAFRDVTSGEELKLSEEHMQKVGAAYDQEKQQRSERVGAENLDSSDEFMATNAAKTGVISTDTGLQYEILQAGSGDSPSAEQSVRVHYKGSLIDGTIFDSSHERGEPSTFPISGVIPGFAEGLQLMKEGGEYRFFIPPDQAYGVNAPTNIGPNQALIFEVELIEVI